MQKNPLKGTKLAFIGGGAMGSYSQRPAETAVAMSRRMTRTS